MMVMRIKEARSYRRSSLLLPLLFDACGGTFVEGEVQVFRGLQGGIHFSRRESHLEKEVPGNPAEIASVDIHQFSWEQPCLELILPQASARREFVAGKSKLIIAQ